MFYHSVPLLALNACHVNLHCFLYIVIAECLDQGLCVQHIQLYAHLHALVRIRQATNVEGLLIDVVY